MESLGARWRMDLGRKQITIILAALLLSLCCVPTIAALEILDAGCKPYNCFIYGHVPDILSVDSYYQIRIAYAHRYGPSTKALYSKAAYVYAVASSCQAACEPHHLHVIVNSCRKHENVTVNHRVFRWGTPEEKRIEVYCNTAAGGRITVHLGRVDVSRFVIITGNPALKNSIQSRYASIYGPRVQQLISVE